MSILLPILGAVLVLLLLWDVFLTVFHPVGRGGPLNRRQNQLLWKAFQALGCRRNGSPRHRILAFGGPTIVVTTLLGWVLILVVAFAMIYYPRIESFLVSPGALRTPWAETLYYSAYTAATLGAGDLVPDSDAMRLITVLEAFGGFALLSISITYFLAVFRELLAMQALAADIAGLFRAGEEQVLDFTREEGYEPLARWCEIISAGLSRVLLAHFQYPVLHYFHSRDRSQALPVQLGAILVLRRGVQLDDESPAIATLARHPSYLALMSGMERYLGRVDELFIPQGDGGDRPGEGDRYERAHARLIAFQCYPRSGGER